MSLDERIENLMVNIEKQLRLKKLVQQLLLIVL
jgi:hypothetical protein